MNKQKENSVVEVEVAMIFSHCESCKVSSRSNNNKCGHCGRLKAVPLSQRKQLGNSTSDEWGSKEGN